jgi:catechol 2,3-dioxygenase-like lactoylglutathione lyase family enzyme
VRARLTSACPILPARDLAAAEAFWRKLGFDTRRFDTEGYLIAGRDGVELHVFRHPALDPAANDAGAYLRVEDVDALGAEWAAAGLPAEGIPRLVPAGDTPWGMRELALIDPDGNLIRAGAPVRGDA